MRGSQIKHIASVWLKLCLQGDRSWWGCASWHLPQVEYLFKFSCLKVRYKILLYLICKPFPQQVWGRILHHLVLPALAHRPPPLPWHRHLRYQVPTISASHISIILVVGILCFNTDLCAQITKIHEAVNAAESAKSQLLDAPCRRRGTGSKLILLIPRN